MSKLTLSAVIAATLTTAGSAYAATLQSGDHLTIGNGSYFEMYNSGAIPISGEPTAFGYDGGLYVGSAPGDTGTGSHSFGIAPGDTGAATQQWEFLGNTGYDYLSSNGSGTFGGDTTNGVDMTAWTVTWNGIANIPMGGCFLQTGGCSTGTTVFSDTGIGDFVWSGIYGDTYTISYTAHVPVDDPSNIGGVQYDLFLTGVVQAQVVPIPSAFWLLGSGLLGLLGLARRHR